MPKIDQSTIASAAIYSPQAAVPPASGMAPSAVESPDAAQRLRAQDALLLTNTSDALLAMARRPTVSAQDASDLRSAAVTVLSLSGAFDTFNGALPFDPSSFQVWNEKLALIGTTLRGIRGCAAELVLRPRHEWAFRVGRGTEVISMTLPPSDREEQAQWVSFGMRMAAAKELADNSDTLRDPAHFIYLSIQSMSNDEGVRACLHAHLDDTAFGRAKLLGMHAHPTSPDAFIARFKDDREWVFSNRGSQKMELRGERLKTALLNEDYDCLRGFLTRLHLGPSDTALHYAFVPVKLNYLPDDDAAWPLTAAERAQVVREMAAIPVGHTTLDRLLGMPLDEAAPALPRIDEPGYVIV